MLPCLRPRICQRSRKQHLTGLLSLFKTMTRALSIFFFEGFYGTHRKNDSRECFQREEQVQNYFFYLRSIVVSIRATYRRGRSNRTRLAAVFMSFQLPRRLDSEREKRKSSYPPSLQKMFSFTSTSSGTSPCR